MAEPLSYDGWVGDEIGPPRLPRLPPLPEADGQLPAGRSLAAILAGLEHGLVGASWAGRDAVIAIGGGRLLDAAVAEGELITARGAEVLDELAGLPAADLTVRPTSRRLAEALPSCWALPAVLQVPLGWLDGVQVLGQLVQPGRRGAILVAAPGELGVALIDEHGPVCAYSDRLARPRGLEALNHLLTHPEACLEARLEAAPSVPAEAPKVQVLPPGTPQEPVPAPRSQAAAGLDRQRQEILAMVRGRLRLHAEPVERCFLAAPVTQAGLLAACDEVRRLRLRLVSPATMDWIADQAAAIVGSG